MSEAITYKPDSKTAMVILCGGKHKIRAGDVVVRGTIPDDAYTYLASRPDFGGDFEKYKAKRGNRHNRPKSEPKAIEAHGFEIDPPPEVLPSVDEEG